MATINLTNLIIPDLAAFDDNNPTRQVENLAYVILQVLSMLRGVAWEISDTTVNLTTVEATLQEIQTVLAASVEELRWQSVTLDLGGLKVIWSRQGPPIIQH